MRSSIQIGFEDYLFTHLDKLCEEYYNRPRLYPEELYGSDIGFRNYCHEAWEDTVNAYDDARENIYN